MYMKVVSLEQFHVATCAATHMCNNYRRLDCQQFLALLLVGNFDFQRKLMVYWKRGLNKL